MTKALLVPTLLVSVLVAGCGGSDGGGQDATPAEEPAATTSIKIEDFAFSPTLATVERGATVTVTNADGVTHTLTADDGSFDTGDLAAGSKTITLDEAGTFAYHCAIHTYMKGMIEVTGS